MNDSTSPAVADPQDMQSLPPSDRDADFDRINTDWVIDKIIQVLVFVGGFSAIIFIIGIFVFIGR